MIRIPDIGSKSRPIPPIHYLQTIRCKKNMFAKFKENVEEVFYKKKKKKNLAKTEAELSALNLL